MSHEEGDNLCAHDPEERGRHGLGPEDGEWRGEAGGQMGAIQRRFYR